MTTFFDKYFAVWALFLPISSILVVPSIQGTTPAYILALSSIGLTVMFNKFKITLYVKDIIVFTSALIMWTCISQLSLSLSNVNNFGYMRLVDANDYSILLRKTMFTQLLYLLASVATFIFVKHFYKNKWDKYIFRGVNILALYGLYEITYYMLFQSNGDFLTNRTFGDGEELSGSLFQIITFGSFSMERLKSLTGEPSMYAFTVLPFWIYAVHTNNKLTKKILLTTLILSTSTTAIIGIATYFIAKLYFTKNRLLNFLCLSIVGILLVLIITYNDAVNDIFNQLILSKITMESFSGMDRFDSFSTSIDFFMGAPFINQLFGIGFGYIRSTDMFTTVLINLGIVGIIITTLLFWFPVYKLSNTYRNIGMKSALIVVYVTMMISVSEYSYLSIWLFLGIAYNQIKKECYACINPNP